MVKSAAIASRDRRISEKLLKSFVEDVTNASEEQSEAGAAYFFKRYPEFFPTLEQDIANLLPYIGGQPGIKNKFLMEQSREIMYRAIVWETRDRLRAIWRSPDQYTADWRVFRLQSALHGMRALRRTDDEDATGDIPPSPNAPINQALTWLRKKFPNLKVCGNEVCQTPYFIRANGKQRFCSVDCAEKAQREYKAAWWNKNGAEWRQRQAVAKAKAASAARKKTSGRSRKKSDGQG